MALRPTPFRYGYNTNGFAHHRLEDAMDVLAEQGWKALALTLDVHHLDPLRSNAADVRKIRHRAETHGLTLAVETGARFVLDPRRKHRPNLLDPDRAERERRLDFLRRCTSIAGDLGAELVSFWAGRRPAATAASQAAAWLLEGIQSLREYAGEQGVSLCLEPEPGMEIETCQQFTEVRSACPGLLLALDVGHLYVTGEEDPAGVIERHADALGQVTLEDMRRGIHDHLAFGEGDVDHVATLHALRRIAWERPVYVELGRHSHDAVETARRSLDFLCEIEASLEA